MTQLAIILTAIFAPIVTGFVLTLLQEDRISKNIVHMPKSLKYIGILFAVLTILLGLAVLLLKYSALLFLASLSGFISLAFLYIYNSVQIQYQKNRFVVKRIFRKKRTYMYTQIEGVILNHGSGFILILDEGRLTVDSLLTGGTDFLCYVQQRYRAHHNEQLPELRFKLFNGNVKEPGPMVFFSIMGGIGWIAVAICMTVKWVYDGDVSLLIIGWSIAVVYWGVCGAGYYVLSNAKKYPRLASLFVKKDYRNW